MPKGPKRRKAPTDVISNAVKVMRIATGDETETLADEARTPPPWRSARAGAKRRTARREGDATLGGRLGGPGRRVA